MSRISLADAIWIVKRLLDGQTVNVISATEEQSKLLADEVNRILKTLGIEERVSPSCPPSRRTSPSAQR